MAESKRSYNILNGAQVNNSNTSKNYMRIH